jgi:hypothetical protein
LYVPAVKAEMIVLVPLPAIAPGLIVQLPVAGRPESTTLPVATEHVGSVIVPTLGAAGPPGAAVITTLDVAAEIQPAEEVTVKL